VTVLPSGVELRAARLEDRDAVVALLHERMNSRISPERWRRLFDYSWLADKPDCGVVVLERGRLAGFLAVIYADRQLDGRTVRTGNFSSWYLDKPLRRQGIGLAMLRHAARHPAVTYTVFSSKPPVLRLMSEVGLILLEDTRYLWRRSGARGTGIEVFSGFPALLPEVADSERKILTDHHLLPVTPYLLRAAEGDCLVVLSIKYKGADVAYHDVLHIGRPAVFAHHAQVFADAVLPSGAAVLAVDRRFLDGYDVIAETEPIAVPRYFRSAGMARNEVDFLYSEIPLLDLKLE
jgi:hypothetical protein